MLASVAARRRLGSDRAAGAGDRARARSAGRILLALWALAGLALSLGTAAAGGAGASSDPVDRAAVAGYLSALYTFKQAQIADAHASIEAASTLAGRLANECPSVLAGAPSREPVAISGPHRTNGRERGEAERHSRQLGALEIGLELDVFTAANVPDREAQARFAAAVAGLRWSDARVGQALSAFAAPQTTQASSAGSLCADASAWVGSGYHSIASDLKETERRLSEDVTALPTGGTLQLRSLFERNEGSAARAAIGRIEALGPASQALEEAVQAQQRRARTALGFHSEGFLAPVPTTRIGTLPARAGGFFKVSVQHTEATLAGCQAMIAVEYTTSQALGFGTSVTSGGSTICLPHGSLGASSPVSCEAGVITVQERTSAAVRRVRMRLSDGRTITSGVVQIPRRYGGPAVIYAQGLRGPSPYPVSLSELGARGRIVAVVRLPAERHCRERRVTEARIVTLAHGATAAGASFTISAGVASRNAVGRNLLRGVPRVLLVVTGDAFGEDDDNLLEANGLLEAAGAPAGRASGRQTGPLQSPSLQASCPPGEAAIFYGLLRAKGDTASMRTAKGLVPLAKVPLPAELHEPADLLWGVFETVPSELVVQGPGGTRVYAERLEGLAHEHREFCEGFAE
jgi:hypothetical protein